MTGFALDGFTVRRLSPADAAELQALYERCSDYHELEDGGPTRPTAGAETLAAGPPGTDPADKFSLGVYADGGAMVAFLDVIRDYPEPGEWWIGLLMLDPAARSGGLGGRICEEAARWIAAEGGRALHLDVLEQNPRAERFWRRHGFEEVRRKPFTAATGKESTVIVMRRALASEPA
jgi:ribosomal protein S18 acetylase RimI-like enzyme